MTDRQSTLQRVCDFLGETYEPAMLTMDGAVRFGDARPATAANVPDQSGTESMPRRELAFTQAYAGQHIVELGYDLQPLQLSLKERLLFNVIDRPANLASMFAWRTLQTIRS